MVFGGVQIVGGVPPEILEIKTIFLGVPVTVISKSLSFFLVILTPDDPRRLSVPPEYP